MTLDTITLIFGAGLFFIGTAGVLIRRNVIVVLMCIELMLNAANLSLFALSYRFGTLEGHVYVFFVMAVAAAEAAVGVAIFISVFRNFYTVQSSNVHTLQG